ncbi:cytidylate kinase-like family protein [Prevotella sp. E9-3]|uniref:cytidylate kinase-like family protein n=1 Tax=Prevotella sp. E9-3 TaxID=2913621 RepID=UPI001EDA7FE5|nr:cytidylate kinase-like family protein [Prevotella sp. E9-3]UKK47667.1 cytidylate kinase-like family protein [Prevotella sp. E9-3]
MDRKIIINIGRQLGAGGLEIGRMLAQEFHAKYYDRELLNLAAEESGFSAEFFKRNDERKGFLRSFLSLPYGNGVGSTNFYQNNFSQESLFKFQSDAIRKAADEGSCVFLGRCADYVLRDYPNVVNVFITASLDTRIHVVAETKGISADEAKKIIEQKEKNRAEYYNYYTGKQWGYAASYDLCIDASLLGFEATERIIADFVRKKLQLTD